MAERVREVQALEKEHLEKRVAINDRMVKLARDMYELNKRKFIEKDEELEEATAIDSLVAPRVTEIDTLRREESKVLQDINEEVEALRRLSQSVDIDDDEY